MKTKETEDINIIELKQEVHTGILEALVLLRRGRDKINALFDDEEIRNYPASSIIEDINNISSEMASFSCKLSDMIGLLFLERLELKFDVLKKQKGLAKK